MEPSSSVTCKVPQISVNSEKNNQVANFSVANDAFEVLNSLKPSDRQLTLVFDLDKTLMFVRPEVIGDQLSKGAKISAGFKELPPEFPGQSWVEWDFESASKLYDIGNYHSNANEYPEMREEFVAFPAKDRYLSLFKGILEANNASKAGAIAIAAHNAYEAMHKVLKAANNCSENAAKAKMEAAKTSIEADEAYQACLTAKVNDEAVRIASESSILAKGIEANAANYANRVREAAHKVNEMANKLLEESNKISKVAKLKLNVRVIFMTSSKYLKKPILNIFNEIYPNTIFNNHELIDFYSKFHLFGEGAASAYSVNRAEDIDFSKADLMEKIYQDENQDCLKRRWILIDDAKVTVAGAKERGFGGELFPSSLDCDFDEECPKLFDRLQALVEETLR